MKPQRMLIALILLFSTLPLFAQVDTNWVRKIDYANQEPVYGAGRLLAVDKEGNVYLGADGNPFDPIHTRYVVAKYNSCGDTLWVRRAGGSVQAIPRALAVDDSGYVYVTGHNGTGTGENYYTVKFKPNGDTAWAREYTGPNNNHDNPTDIALDKNRNVIVTGFSPGTGMPVTSDYATIKYAPNGDTVWVRRYNSGTDIGKALAVDTAGNVYVTGWGGAGQGDYVTIKYSPAGVVLWTRTYNGPYNGLDDPNDLEVDLQGNVYVTGRSLGAGTASTDIATIKYAPNGDTLWVRRYASPGDSSDFPSALEVDATGNVYITGYSGIYSTTGITIKYDPNGNIAWTRQFVNNSMHSLALDKNGNIYVTGNSNTGIVTAMFNPANGDTVWTRRYSFGSTAAANHIVVDTAGNVYVGGNTGGSEPDVTLIKYSSDPPCPPHGSAYTAAGTNVFVQPYTSVFVIFDMVSAPGVTTVTLNPSGPTPPGSFSIVPTGSPVYYDITTTATYNDSVAICLFYVDSLVGNEDSLELLHYNGSTWVNITLFHDKGTNQICGKAPSLSPFALAIPSACLAKPGDANNSGTLSLADAIVTVNYLFNRPGFPACSQNSYICWLSGLLCRGDWNGNGSISLQDVVASVNYLFSRPGGPWNPVASGACCLP